MRTLGLLLLFLPACQGRSEPGARPSLEGDDFFDRPFPDDRRTVDGHPVFDGFPNQGVYELADAYLDTGRVLDGFGTNAPIWLRFESPIDTAALPDALTSLSPYSTIQLVDVTPGSPDRGESTPLQWEWTEPVTQFQPGNLLAIAPVWGFPLRAATTYAVLLRSPLVPADLSPDLWEDRALDDAAATLEGLGWSLDDVAYAWTFTTQDPTKDMATIARAIQEDLSLQPLAQPVLEVANTAIYTAYEGKVLLPVWQHGERPYHTSGGELEFDADGEPVIYRWERVTFAVTIPKGPTPATGWPVVLYAHGTGGDQRTAFASGESNDEAWVLAEGGVATFAVSQPLHGDRATPDTNVDLDTFNFYNPDAGRTNFRQGALDQVYLARLLRSSSLGFTSPDGPILLDGERVAFMGHSQGGLVGALAVPFLSPQLRAAAFSGTGGGLSLTLTQRTDPLDFALVIAGLLQFDEGEAATPFHPVIGLIQTLTEVTDPLNYGPALFAMEPPWSATPTSVIFTEGMEDPLTPPDTVEALTAAARVPIVGEPASSPESHRLRGLEVVGLPTEANTLDWAGHPITAGVHQFPGQGHFAIYEDSDAQHYYQNFLVGALVDNAPRLDESAQVEDDLPAARPK